jgi:hypothetical protein
MFKLAAAIRNYFVVVPYIEAKAPSSRRPASTPPLSRDSSFVSLAGKAPAVCSQLQRMGR